MPCHLSQLRVLRSVLLASAFTPAAVLAMALACYESRLAWQTWRLPFVSELAAGPEGNLFRFTLTSQAVSIAYMAVTFLTAQLKHVRYLQAASLKANSECRRKAARTLRIVLVVAYLEFAATLGTALGLILIARFEVFKNLVAHLIAVMFSYGCGCSWLACACFVEWCLQSRHFFNWFSLRVGGAAAGVSSSLGCMAIGVKTYEKLSAPLDVLKRIEDHTRNGIICNDSDFPLESLNILAFFEWAMLVALPGYFLVTFWDSTQFLRQLPRERQPWSLTLQASDFS